MAIAVKLMGGCGNQMFQYAMGLAQARRLGVELVLDVSLLGGYRKYQLDQWGFGNWKPVLITGSRTTIAEGSIRYNQEIVSRLKDGDVLEGYWQTEKYFINVRNEILQIFVPRNTLSLEAAALKLEIDNTNSIFLHIRRGDYLNPYTKRLHGLLSMQYYQTAMNYITERVSNPKFFIFSDDFEWAKQNFIGEQFVVVQPNIEAVDIYLMSHCKYAIIANSTFGWWGAWLGIEHRDRIVIAPSQWFQELNDDPRDIVPEQWFKI